MTALYELRLRDRFSRGDTLGDGPAALDGARRVTRVVARPGDLDGDLAGRYREADPTCGSMPSSRRPRRSCAARTAAACPDLRDILDVVREDGGLPGTDQVHDFVDLLERMADLRD